MIIIIVPEIIPLMKFIIVLLRVQMRNFILNHKTLWWWVAESDLEQLNNFSQKLANKTKVGDIFLLSGDLGAGKTTFLNILAGTVIKNSGSVNVWNYDLDQNPRQVRSSIGIVPQEVNLDAFFSPRKLLELQAGLYGISEKNRIIL